MTVDQRSGGGAWRSIGTFNLAAGDRDLIGVSPLDQRRGGYVIADAMRVTRVDTGERQRCREGA